MVAVVVAQLLSKEFIEFHENKYFIRAVGDSATATVTDAENVPHVDDGHIPHVLSEKMVQMVLENKRYGGSTIRHMEFNESQRSAIVEYEDRTGKSVDRLLVL